MVKIKTKRLPMKERQETQVPPLGPEDPLDKEPGTHSSILAWRSPMDRRAWRATVRRVAKSWTRLRGPGAGVWSPVFTSLSDCVNC